MTTAIQRPLRLHIKNNRAGEETFRMTRARYDEVAARHPDIAPHVEAFIDWDLDNFKESIRTAHAMVTWGLPTENLAEVAPNLRLIHIIGAGVEHLQPIDWLPRGTTLTNNRGVHAEKTAESALMAVLMLNNNIPKYIGDQAAKRWAPEFATPIAGKTVVCVGVGQMGGAAARAFKQIGLKVLGVRRGGGSHRAVDRMYRTSELNEAIAQADFVHLTLPQTPETIGLIDAAALAAMKPGAGIINFGRAPILDHAALIKGLKSGRIGGAVLDVHDPEPLPVTSPIWEVRNLMVLPHVTSDDDQAYVPMTLDLVFQNLGRLLDGRPLINKVRPKLGY